MMPKTPSNRKPAAWLLPLAISLMCVMTARADTIRLDNDRVIRGVIESETPEQVVVRIGGGLVRLDRARIVAIERGDSGERELRMAEWRRQHFLEPAFVPAAMAPLAADVRRLLRERANLAATAAALRRLEAGKNELLGAVERLRNETAAAARALADAAPDRDPAGYNRRAAALNAALAAEQENRAALAAIRAEIIETGRIRDEYIRFFDRIVEQRRKTIAAGVAETEFLDALDGRLAELRRDFREYRIDAETRGSVNVISVRVNDRADGRFIVDTGAGPVTIIAAFAARLGIPPPHPDAPKVALTLADGRGIEAHPVTLATVSVAGHTAENVQAVIMPDPPGEGLDGLLGMSFLRRFHVAFEPSGGLVLRALDPRARRNDETPE